MPAILLLKACFESAVLLGLIYFLFRAGDETEAIKLGSVLIMSSVLFSNRKEQQ
jgi:hypothetical protein